MDGAFVEQEASDWKCVSQTRDFPEFTDKQRERGFPVKWVRVSFYRGILRCQVELAVDLFPSPLTGQALVCGGLTQPAQQTENPISWVLHRLRGIRIKLVHTHSRLPDNSEYPLHNCEDLFFLTQ